MFLIIEGQRYFSPGCIKNRKYGKVLLGSLHMFDYKINNKGEYLLNYSGPRTYNSGIRHSYYDTIFNLNSIFAVDENQDLVYLHKEGTKMPFKFRVVTNIAVIDGNVLINTGFIPCDKICSYCDRETLNMFVSIFDRHYKGKCCTTLLKKLTERSCFRPFAIWNCYAFYDNEDFKYLVSNGYVDLLARYVCYSRQTFKTKIKELRKAVGETKAEDIKQNEVLSKYIEKGHSKEVLLKLVSEGFDSDDLVTFKKCFGNFSRISLTRFSLLKKLSTANNKDILISLLPTNRVGSIPSLFSLIDNIYYASSIEECCGEEGLYKRVQFFVNKELNKIISDKNFSIKNLQSLKRETDALIKLHLKWCAKENFNKAYFKYRNFIDEINSRHIVETYRGKNNRYIAENENIFRNLHLCLGVEDFGDDYKTAYRKSLAMLNGSLVFRYSYHCNGSDYCIKSSIEYDMRTGKFDSKKANDELQNLRETLYPIVCRPFQEQNSLFSVI